MLDDPNPSSASEASARPRGMAPSPARGGKGQEDEPLDPAVERVRVKLARLMVVSIGTLLVGVLAVLGAVIYRGSDDGSTPVGTGSRDISLVPGATLRGADLSPNGLLLTIDLPDGTTELVVLDPASAATRLRVRLAPRAGE